MRLSPQGVARWSAKRRFTVIAIWVGLFLVGGLLTSRYLSGALTTQAQFTNNPDSKQAQQLLEQRLSGPRRANEVVIVRSESQTVTDPDFKAYVQRLVGGLDALGPAVVQQATDPLPGRQPAGVRGPPRHPDPGDHGRVAGRRQRQHRQGA